MHLHFKKSKLNEFIKADRAKQIKTRATVNEDPTEKAIRDLKAENQRLKSLLSKGNVDPQWLKTHSVSVNSNNPLGILHHISLKSEICLNFLYFISFKRSEEEMGERSKDSNGED